MDQFPATIDSFWHINFDLFSEQPFHLQDDKEKDCSDNEWDLSLITEENTDYGI